MSISKTTILKNIVISPAINAADTDNNSGWPKVVLKYTDTFTDPDDITLPITQDRSKVLYKFSNEENGDLTDFSEENELIQSICTAIWS